MAESLHIKNDNFPGLTENNGGLILYYPKLNNSIPVEVRIRIRNKVNVDEDHVDVVKSN